VIDVKEEHSRKQVSLMDEIDMEVLLRTMKYIDENMIVQWNLQILE
jgi:hypothetical protein